uniref:Uncharacterized protein n=1 Tax=Setaria digitata TaxID=48799 RepID=A0A915PDD6_9BILA
MIASSDSGRRRSGREVELRRRDGDGVGDARVQEKDEMEVDGSSAEVWRLE